MSLLSVKSISKTFGGLKALQDVSFEVPAGKIISIIGPNGAGKTTLFNCLSGIYTPDEGSIQLEGESIQGLPPHQICRRGIARTFQNIRLFNKMTVLENVLMGEWKREQINPLGLLFRTKAYRARQDEERQEALRWLEFVGLKDKSDLTAQSLSYGFQRRLEIARALATRPRVLLLDEPGAGMNPSEIGEMIQLITRIRDEGVAVVLIEHHMKVVMEISNYIVVLDHGEELANGTPAEIRSHPEVVSAYLGSSNA